jgi:hypothetical protein
VIVTAGLGSRVLRVVPLFAAGWRAPSPRVERRLVWARTAALAALAVCDVAYAGGSLVPGRSRLRSARQPRCGASMLRAVALGSVHHLADTLLGTLACLRAGESW